MRDDQVSYHANKAAHQILTSGSPTLPKDATEKAILAVRVIWHTAGCLQHLKAVPGGV